MTEAGALVPPCSDEKRELMYIIISTCTQAFRPCRFRTDAPVYPEVFSSFAIKMFEGYQS